MRDHRLVRIALFLFFVALSLVYAIFFQSKSEKVRADIIVILQHWGFAPGTVTQTGQQSTGMQDISTGETSVQPTLQTTQVVTGEDSFLNEVLGTSSGKVLSGTQLYYGSLDILKNLGIRYDYILKDSNYDIFYAYIGKNTSYSISDLVRSFGGKTVEIYAKNDIVNNLYFGDRVTIVTLPSSPDSITSLFVRMGDDLWLIHDITGEYKKHKRYIRSLFTGK